MSERWLLEIYCFGVILEFSNVKKWMFGRWDVYLFTIVIYARYRFHMISALGKRKWVRLVFDLHGLGRQFF